MFVGLCVWDLPQGQKRCFFAAQLGFTMIELLMVVVVIGILAVAAIPLFYGFREDAHVAQMQGIATQVRSGIMTWHYNRLMDNSDTYPSSLDATVYPDVCGTGGRECFGVVLVDGVSSSDPTRWYQWRRGTNVAGGQRYLYHVSSTANNNTSAESYRFIYDSTNGSFYCLEYSNYNGGAFSSPCPNGVN